ncbi:MAG TPA: hypothetical protein VIJ79_10270 [Acidobacteriaceae bacterium]
MLRQGNKSCGPFLLRTLRLALVLPLVAHAAAPRPQPAVRLQLADLGVPGIPQFLQGQGASLLTVHFVDPTHLLVTYNLRDLVERIPGDPPGDTDRSTAALLLELPSGKVLARTRWHLHDYSQYLWSLGKGRFLLRMHSTLTSFAPLANLASGNAFRQTPFVQVPGTIDAIIVAPEGDLVTLEASPPRKPKPPSGPVTFLNAGDPDARPPENIFFVRVSGTGSPESPVLATSAGSVKAERVAPLPLNGRGYLSTTSQKHMRWTMQFNSFDGPVRKLSYVDSSCAPWMQFVSPSQFLVFSCRGSDDRILLSAFDFSPQEMWEEPMGSSSPTAFLYAQQAGRFALSRITSIAPLASGPASLTGPGPWQGADGDLTTTQEISIYQVESGDLLLKLPCSPVSRTGQNFDLAPDGLSAMVVRNGAIEIYNLPPLSKQDKKQLAAVQQLEPQIPTSATVELHLLVHPVEDADDAAATQPSPAKPQPQPVAPPIAAAAPSAPTLSAPAASTAAAANEGDVSVLHRKPPTLLNPGETVDGAKNPPPQ